MQVAEIHILQAVAGRANFRVDLKPPLKLELIEAAKRAFKREVKILDLLVTTACRLCAACKAKGQCETEKGLFHHFLSPHSAG